jgi:hypothetical protein
MKRILGLSAAMAGADRTDTAISKPNAWEIFLIERLTEGSLLLNLAALKISETARAWYLYLTGFEDDNCAFLAGSKEMS